MWTFLERIFKGSLNIETPLRPPGAVKEDEFLRRCIKCNKCAQVCSYDSIVMGHLNDGRNYGTPVIIAREVPCYLCMECPPVCPTGALDNDLTEKETVKMGIAVIDEDMCFPYMGVLCLACFLHCPIYREAIILEDERYPKIIADKCTGCGICEHVCPAEEGAIVIEPNHKTAARRVGS